MIEKIIRVGKSTQVMGAGEMMFLGYSFRKEKIHGTRSTQVRECKKGEQEKKESEGNTRKKGGLFMRKQKPKKSIGKSCRGEGPKLLGDTEDVRQFEREDRSSKGGSWLSRRGSPFRGE